MFFNEDNKVSHSEEAFIIYKLVDNTDQIGIVSKMLKLLLIDPEADLLIPISSNKIKYSFYSHISNEKKNILELQEKVKNYKSIF